MLISAIGAMVDPVTLFSPFGAMVDLSAIGIRVVWACRKKKMRLNAQYTVR